MVKSSPEKLAKALRANLKKRKGVRSPPPAPAAPENPAKAPDSRPVPPDPTTRRAKSG